MAWCFAKGYETKTQQNDDVNGLTCHKTLSLILRLEHLTCVWLWDQLHSRTQVSLFVLQCVGSWQLNLQCKNKIDTEVIEPLTQVTTEANITLVWSARSNKRKKTTRILYLINVEPSVSPLSYSVDFSSASKSKSWKTNA